MLKLSIKPVKYHFQIDRTTHDFHAPKVGIRFIAKLAAKEVGQLFAFSNILFRFSIFVICSNLTKGITVIVIRKYIERQIQTGSGAFLCSVLLLCSM